MSVYVRSFLYTLVVASYGYWVDHKFGNVRDFSTMQNAVAVSMCYVGIGFVAVAFKLLGSSPKRDGRVPMVLALIGAVCTMLGLFVVGTSQTTLSIGLALPLVLLALVAAWSARSSSSNTPPPTDGTTATSSSSDTEEQSLETEQPVDEQPANDDQDDTSLSIFDDEPAEELVSNDDDFGRLQLVPAQPDSSVVPFDVEQRGW